MDPFAAPTKRELAAIPAALERYNRFQNAAVWLQVST
jgi:hypothetical protein